MQWATALGLRVIGTVSNDNKARIAREAGCSDVINYRTENFVERVLELIGGEGVRAVFDSVGKDTFRDSLKVPATRGTLITFGKASGDFPDMNPFELAPRAQQLAWPTWRNAAPSAPQCWNCRRKKAPTGSPEGAFSI